MKNEKDVVEVLDETTDEVAEIEKADKVTFFDRISESKPVRVVKRHWKGFVAGAATVTAVGAAAVLAGKAAADGTAETPLILDDIKDAAADVIES